jgi:hypothetical protein
VRQKQARRQKHFAQSQSVTLVVTANNEESMKSRIIIINLVALVLSWQVHAQAQDAAVETTESRAFRLEGRHAITVSVGFMANAGSGASVTIGSHVASSSHAVGWIGYAHWFEEDWALQVETGGMAANVDVTARLGEFSTEASVLVPLLLGVRHQFRLGERSAVRPFLAAMAGPYLLVTSRTRARPIIWQGGTRTAGGARFGAGLDLLVGKRFRVGSELRYHAVGDFEWQDAQQENYSGFEFSVGFGILLGGRR